MLRKEVNRKYTADIAEKRWQGKESESSTGREGILKYEVFPLEATEHITHQFIEQITSRLEYAEKIANQLASQLAEKTGELDRLREYVTKLEEGEKGLVQELTQQLAMKDEEISRIAALYAKKEAENRKMASQLESHIGLQRQHAEKIKGLLLKKEEETAKLVEGLRKQLEAKNSEVSSLRGSLLELEKSQSINLSLQGLPSTAAHVQQMQAMHKELEGKNSELKQMEKAFIEEQKLNRSIQTRLKEQIAQTEELKAFLIEKEKLAQNLESAFEKRLAAKEEELRHLKGLIHAKPETRLHRQLDELKSELHIKEETARMMAEELAKLKEQSALLLKRLGERQKIFFESEKAYEELIAKLRQQHDARIRALVQESAQKETILKSALEMERTRLQKETTLMREKEKQIEETLQAFTTTSQQLLKLQGTAQLGEPEANQLTALKTELENKEKQLAEKEAQLQEEKQRAEAHAEAQRKYIHNKEVELKKLLESTEAKIAELKEKEAGIERKEQLLLKEQEALNKELEVLTSAGIEIGRSRQYIQQKLASIGFEQPAQQQMQQPQQQIAMPVETAEFVEEQPYKPQPTQRITRQQAPSAQELRLGGAGGVQEAQEEEGSDAPKFTGITSGAGAATGEVKEALEEGEDFALAVETSIKKAPAATVSAARKAKATIMPKIKPAAVAKTQARSKKQQKILTRKLKPTVKKDLKQRKQPLQQPKQKLKHLQLPKKASVAAKEMPKGKGLGQGLGLPEELRGKEGQELFTELGGYSEIDEIKSVVEVGLQHGDSIEQIRQSLITSGYSKQNIEKVLSSVKK